MNENDDPIDVPAQHIGNKLTVEHSVFAESVADAVYLFDQSVRRLLHVNDWGKLANSLLSNFQVTDAQGRDIFREAQEGDLFKIDIPGPGRFDWVKVEIVKMKTNRVAMRVRPAASPLETTEQVAHFFKDYATSTFQVFRRGRIVTAGVYGRNEVPNTQNKNVVEKIRNAGVAIGAIAGASKIQWESLVKGILNETSKS
jgi:hypothetical protein